MMKLPMSPRHMPIDIAIDAHSQDTPVKLLLRVKKARRAQEKNDSRILELHERMAKKIMAMKIMDEERMKLVEPGPQVLRREEQGDRGQRGKHHHETHTKEPLRNTGTTSPRAHIPY